MSMLYYFNITCYITSLWIVVFIICNDYSNSNWFKCKLIVNHATIKKTAISRLSSDLDDLEVEHSVDEGTTT